MNMEILLFYLFSGVLLGTALLVVTVRNTVYGVLCLILAFFNASGLFILAQAEFLAMILIIVYVGAVAVLFLFVVMMLNVNTSSPQYFSRSYFFAGILVGGILVGELILMLMKWTLPSEAFTITFAPQNHLTNTQALGNLLYTHYALIFQIAGLILLIAMVGSIVLTLRHREGTRKQKVSDQLARQAKESVQLIDLSRNKGGESCPLV